MTFKSNMPQIKNVEAPGPVHAEAIGWRLLALVTQAVNNAASVKSLFREIGRQLLTHQLADAVSLLIYDDDAVRITELLVMTDPRHIDHETFRDSPFGGLSLSGTEAAGLTALAGPGVVKAPKAFDKLYKANAPLHFFTRYRQQLHLPLTDKKRPIATLTVHAGEPHTWSDQLLFTFDIIAGHFSMAMRLHAVGVEKERVEAEKKGLLALGKALADAKDKEGLIAVMQAQFRSLFPSGDIVISIADKERQTHAALLFLPEKDGHSAHAAITSASYPIDDGFYKQVLTSGKANLFNMEDLIRQKRVPAYIRYWFDNGIREIVAVAMRSGQTSIGSLFILRDRHHRPVPGQMIPMQAAAIHLSMAIVNVLTAEKSSSHPSAISQGRPVPTEKGTGIIGSSPAMRRVRELISQVAMTDSTILILGETGTGKELVAKAIHENSTRRDKPVVKVNCAALPADLIESELFGHEKGSFTDAIDRKTGKFEMAHNGTLFLDEIGELPFDLQVKLLRVLQEKEIERIGGKEVIRTDVRIIAATNRCLRKEMEAGRFRSDLYYRLNVLPLLLPPLRERKEDIPALAAHFIDKYAYRTGKQVAGLSPHVLQELMAYHWPGNIRELEHLLERGILLNQSPQITEIDLPVANPTNSVSKGSSRLKTLGEVERDHIIAILKKCNGKVAGPGGAADLLSIPSTTLNGKIRRLGIKKDFIAD